MYDNFSNLDHGVFDSDICKSFIEFNNVDSLLADQTVKQNSDSDTGKVYSKFNSKKVTLLLWLAHINMS